MFTGKPFTLTWCSPCRTALFVDNSPEGQRAPSSVALRHEHFCAEAELGEGDVSNAERIIIRLLTFQSGGWMNRQSLDNCPTCGKDILDTDDNGMEDDWGQRWCRNHIDVGELSPEQREDLARSKNMPVAYSIVVEGAGEDDRSISESPEVPDDWSFYEARDDSYYYRTADGRRAAVHPLFSLNDVEDAR